MGTSDRYECSALCWLCFCCVTSIYPVLCEFASTCHHSRSPRVLWAVWELYVITVNHMFNCRRHAVKTNRRMCRRVCMYSTLCIFLEALKIVTRGFGLLRSLVDTVPSLLDHMRSANTCNSLLTTCFL